MRIAIIGGGAAGLMALAAAQEANPAAEIHLLERNDAVGRKVMISGGGRCNVTTGLGDVREVLLRYPRGGKFLTSAMHKFPPAAVSSWFEAHGVALKTEDDMRVFPASNNGCDIIGVFAGFFRRPGVTVHLGAAVEAVERTRDSEPFMIRLRGQAEPLAVDRVIVTTGGQAYRQTGSTGDGYDFAASFGHTITPLAPSLSALHVQEAWAPQLAGVSFQHARLNVKSTGENTAGAFIFSHKGLTGPAVFAVSSLIAHTDVSPGTPLELDLDFLPAEDAEHAVTRLNQSCQQYPTRFFENMVTFMVPKALAEVAIRETGLDGRLHAGKVGKREMQRLVGWLKRTPLHVIGRAAGEEFVTAGGVDLKEVNPATMESIFEPGLYFAGEILDIDGFTGGFNLQAAWATGHLAGESAAKE